MNEPISPEEGIHNLELYKEFNYSELLQIGFDRRSAHFITGLIEAGKEFGSYPVKIMVTHEAHHAGMSDLVVQGLVIADADYSQVLATRGIGKALPANVLIIDNDLQYMVAELKSSMRFLEVTRTNLKREDMGFLQNLRELIATKAQEKSFNPLIFNDIRVETKQDREGKIEIQKLIFEFNKDVISAEHPLMQLEDVRKSAHDQRGIITVVFEGTKLRDLSHQISELLDLDNGHAGPAK